MNLINDFSNFSNKVLYITRFVKAQQSINAIKHRITTIHNYLKDIMQFIMPPYNLWRALQLLRTSLHG